MPHPGKEFVGIEGLEIMQKCLPKTIKSNIVSLRWPQIFGNDLGLRNSLTSPDPIVFVGGCCRGRFKVVLTTGY
jgi:hypothetical protein